MNHEAEEEGDLKRVPDTFYFKGKRSGAGLWARTADV
jgi:hypothetical protein